MSSSSPAVPLFSSYTSPSGVYDEAFANGTAREHWKQLSEKLSSLGIDELRRRTAQAGEILDENGVTYGAIEKQSSNQRPWTLDLIPMVLPEATWTSIAEGIDQRARLYDRLIRDLYGDQTAIHEGWIEPESVFAHSGFLHAAKGLHSGPRSLSFYAAELARSPDGRIWVMADRADAPVGAGFALENRIISKRSMPYIDQALQIRRLAMFFSNLKETLKSLSPRNIEHPRIALLSSGPKSSYYFEDVYLARYLGYDLTQGSDLAVRDDQVFLKTLAGLVPVDVILLRGKEGAVDPLELGGRGPHGVPGLLQSARAGNVSLVNVPGSGIIEAPVFMAQLPKLCQQFLGESLKLPSIATWWCHRKEDRNYVFDNLPSLVIKPAFTASGGKEYIGANLSPKEITSLRAKIESQPFAWVAQELIQRSAVPMLSPEGGLQPGHIAIRVFAAASTEDRYTVMPGGLVRAAPTSGPMELSVSGGVTSKDLWVLTSAPDSTTSLLPAEQQHVTLKRTGAVFPSRVADDLFWLGQSLEQSDLLARMLRFLLTRIELPGDIDTPESACLTRALAHLGAIEPGYAIGEMAANLRKLSDQLVPLMLESNQPKGLANAVAEMARLVSLVRDWISPETWQQINRAGTDFFHHLSLYSDQTSLADAFDDLILTLASAMGLIDNGMVRGPAWRFLDIGRRIERAQTTATFLKSVVETAEPQHIPTLRMLLEVGDCQMTYRSRYLDDVQQNGVLDLCITDTTNPRSIVSQLERIASHLDALPSHTVDALRNDEKRLAMSSLHQVRMLTSKTLGQPRSAELIAVLKQIEHDMRALSQLLIRKYLLHSGEPRQLMDDRGVIA